VNDTAQPIRTNTQTLLNVLAPEATASALAPKCRDQATAADSALDPPTGCLPRIGSSGEGIGMLSVC
jgi:hypothetical protein